VSQGGLAPPGWASIAPMTGERQGDLEHEVEQLASELQREQSLKHQAEAEARRDAEALRSARAQLRATTIELEKTRARLTGIRRRRSVRLALGVSNRVGRALSGSRQLVSRWLGPSGHLARRSAERARQPSRRDIKAFLDAVREQVPSARLETGPLVSIVILNRDGVRHLERCLPALGTVGYRDVELVVVDNGSSDDSVRYLESYRPRFPVRIIRNEHNASFSAGNNQALTECRGELLLFLNNDVEPIGTDWLGHLVDTVIDDGVVAAGARLVFPRPTGDALAGTGHPALSLQHGGLDFSIRGGAPLARPVGEGEDALTDWARDVREVPALTAACLLVRRDAFEAVGGFTEGYEFGHEDVDLCLKLIEAGGRLRYDGRAVLWHDESATRGQGPRRDSQRRNAANRDRFVATWAPRLYRSVLLDAIDRRGFWRREPLHVALTVTRDDPGAGYGDWFTAHELGDALAALGWQVSYLERFKDRWYTPDPSVDVVIALLDVFDVRRLPPGIVRVAWIRNWTQRWLERAWFDDYDIVLASSEASRRLVAEHSAHRPELFPIATNPARFGDGASDPALVCDVLFTGSHWGGRRAVDEALPALARSGLDVRVYGRGWEDVPGMAELHRGFMDYEQLPAAYRSARVVVDDTASHALPYGAVNSRVFDALAAGALVVTDNEVGSRELFGELIPVWTDPDSLASTVRRLLERPGRSAKNLAAASATVREEHTYGRRADRLRSLIRTWVEAPRIGIRIGIPDWEQAPSWGDLHFARALQRQFGRLGRPSRVHILPDWKGWTAARDDLSLHLFGLSTGDLRPGQLNVLWHISHPDRASAELYERYDLVFVASTPFARRMADEVRVPVRPLHQATDDERFQPRAGGPSHELLLVANSRAVPRRILEDLLPTGHDLAVFGRRWTPELLDPRYLRGEHVPNERLAEYYAAASIVLNDHWSDMRREAFISNRLYDASAAGGFVISDHVDGLDDEFDGGIVVYKDAADLRVQIDWYLEHPDERRAKAERARAAVIARHTFRHRALDILDGVATLESGRPLTVSRGQEVSGD
jgi:GT2 family glycosyltransferase/spore maturation protein CgeB